MDHASWCLRLIWRAAWTGASARWASPHGRWRAPADGHAQPHFQHQQPWPPRAYLEIIAINSVATSAFYQRALDAGLIWMMQRCSSRWRSTGPQLIHRVSVPGGRQPCRAGGAGHRARRHHHRQPAPRRMACRGGRSPCEDGLRLMDGCLPTFHQWNTTPAITCQWRAAAAAHAAARRGGGHPARAACGNHRATAPRRFTVTTRRCAPARSATHHTGKIFSPCRHSFPEAAA